MKGKRYTTEDKIRILRDADRGKSILGVCREHNLSEVSFPRWKRPFAQRELERGPPTRGTRTRERRTQGDARGVAAQKPGACSRGWKKMVSPAHRRQGAHALVKRGRCAGRAVCRLPAARAQPVCARQRRPGAGGGAP